MNSPRNGEGFHGAELDLWWAVPGFLAGMPMPLIHPERRERFGAPLDAFDDDLPLLHRAGIGAVIGLLNISSDAAVYRAAGFEYLSMPIPDGSPPSLAQFMAFLRFVREQQSLHRAVAVHCAAGIGRTGTMLAGWLIANGASVEAAVKSIRIVRRGAIETPEQMRFLYDLPAALRNNAGA